MLGYPEHPGPGKVSSTDALQAAQKYTWQLTGAGGIYYSLTDTYANGRASVAGREMVFKAHAQACQ